MKLKWKRFPHAWCADGNAGEYQVQHRECWIDFDLKNEISKSGWSPSVTIGKKMCQMVEDYYCKKEGLK